MSGEGRGASLTQQTRHLSELLFYQEGGREGVVSWESLFDLISLFCRRRLGRQTAEPTSWAELKLPTWGCGSLPPPHTHTYSPTLGGNGGLLNENPKGLGGGGKPRRCRQSPGSANRPVQLCHHRPPAHTEAEAEAGSGVGGRAGRGGRLSPAPPPHPLHSPVPKSHARKKTTRLRGLAGALSLWGARKGWGEGGGCPMRVPSRGLEPCDAGQGRWGRGVGVGSPPPCSPPARGALGPGSRR